MSTRQPTISSTDELAEFCRARHIRRLAIFGSRSRGDFRPDSDLDVLVEFEPGMTPGLAFFRIQEELSEIFGVTVDLNTAGWLSPRFRDDVVRQAEDLYVAAG